MSAFQLLIWVLIVNLLAILSLILLRTLNRFQNRRRERFFEIWRPLLLQYSLGIQGALPELRRSQYLLFLLLWTDLKSALKGQDLSLFHNMIDQLKLRPWILTTLEQGSKQEKMVLAQVVGELAESRAWSSLLKLSQSPDPMLVFLALRSLLSISSKAAIPVVIEILKQNPTLFRHRLSAVLRRSPHPDLVAPIGTALEALLGHELNKDQLAFAIALLSLLDVLAYPAIFPYLRKVLQQAQEPELLCAALEIVGRLRDPESIKYVQALIEHPLWQIKLSAIQALSYLAQPEHIPILLKALDHSHWWVIYHSIDALCRIPGIRPEKLVELYRHPNPLVAEVMQSYQKQVNLNDSR